MNGEIIALCAVGGGYSACIEQQIQCSLSVQHNDTISTDQGAGTGSLALAPLIMAAKGDIPRSIIVHGRVRVLVRKQAGE